MSPLASLLRERLVELGHRLGSRLPAPTGYRGVAFEDLHDGVAIGALDHVNRALAKLDRMAA